MFVCSFVCSGHVFWGQRPMKVTRVTMSWKNSLTISSAGGHLKGELEPRLVWCLVVSSS